MQGVLLIQVVEAWSTVNARCSDLALHGAHVQTSWSKVVVSQRITGFINFGYCTVQLLIEGGYYLRAATINLGCSNNVFTGMLPQLGLPWLTDVNLLSLRLYVDSMCMGTQSHGTITLDSSFRPRKSTTHYC